MATDIQTNGIHPTIAEHYKGMNELCHERDELLVRSNDLQAKLSAAEQYNIFLKTQLDKVTQERDYYYRKSYAFTSTLRSMKDTVEGMFALVDHEAENSTRLPPAANIVEGNGG